MRAVDRRVPPRVVLRLYLRRLLQGTVLLLEVRRGISLVGLLLWVQFRLLLSHIVVLLPVLVILLPCVRVLGAVLDLHQPVLALASHLHLERALLRLLVLGLLVL